MKGSVFAASQSNLVSEKVFKKTGNNHEGAMM